MYFEKYFQFKYILTHIWIYTWTFAFECESHLWMECSPQFGPKHKEYFTVFLIKKSDHSKLFLNYINEFTVFIFKICYYYTELLYHTRCTRTRTLGNVLVLSFEQCTRTQPSPMYSYFTHENVLGPRSAVTPSRLLWEAFSHAWITAQRLIIHISTTVYSHIVN